MNTRGQGYLVMAFGPDRYVEMGANLAASIRIMDPTRRICLVSDRPPATRFRAGFDDFVCLRPDARYPHLMAKLRSFDLSPYEQTMFIDADCLMVKGDADQLWRRAALKPFSITGDKRTSGTWKGLDIETMRQKVGAPYLIQMNSGVFYFDKSAGAKLFFDTVNHLYLTRQHEFDGAHLWGGAGQTTEPYLGVVMGMLGMDTDNMANIGRNSWSVSTWRTVHCTTGGLVFKAGGFLLDRSYLPTRLDLLSPTFLHFVGLKPRWLYNRLVSHIRGPQPAAAFAEAVPSFAYAPLGSGLGSPLGSL